MPQDRVEVEVLTHTEASQRGLQNYLGTLAKVTAGLVAFKKIVVDNAAAGLQYAGSLEKIEATYSVLLKSSERGEKLMDSVREFAATTPFQMERLAEASTRLLNAGTAADEIINVLQDLGNAALGDAEKMDRLTDAYAKLQTKGRASLEELHRFAEAGVPIYQQLAEQMGVTREELFEYISEGKVGFEEVNEALQSLTRGHGDLAGMIETQSETFEGLKSTMRDAWNDARGSLVEGFLPALKEGQRRIIDFLNTAGANIKEWSDQNAGNIYAIFTNLPEIADVAWQATVAIAKRAFTGETMMDILATLGRSLAESLRIGFEMSGVAWNLLMQTVRNTWQSFGDNAGKYLVNGILNGILAGPRRVARLLGFDVGKVDLFDIGDTLTQDISEFTSGMAEAFDRAGARIETNLRDRFDLFRDTVGEVTSFFDDEITTLTKQMDTIMEEGRAEYKLIEQQHEETKKAIEEAPIEVEVQVKYTKSQAGTKEGFLPIDMGEGFRSALTEGFQRYADGNEIETMAREFMGAPITANLPNMVLGGIGIGPGINEIDAQQAAKRAAAAEEAEAQEQLAQIENERLDTMVQMDMVQRAAHGQRMQELSEQKSAIESMTETLEARVPAMQRVFSALGAAIVDQEDGWKRLGETVLGVIADEIQAFGMSMAVKATGALAQGLITKDPTVFLGAAKYGAAAAAAFAASGMIRALGDGGLVTGPTPALVGEAGPEMVIPLDRLPQMGGGTTININVGGSIVSEDQLRGFVTNTVRGMQAAY